MFLDLKSSSDLFRTDIFRKLTLGAPFMFLVSSCALVTRELIYHLMTHYHHDGLLPGEDGE